MRLFSINISMQTSIINEYYVQMHCNIREIYNHTTGKMYTVHSQHVGIPIVKKIETKKMTPDNQLCSLPNCIKLTTMFGL